MVKKWQKLISGLVAFSMVCALLPGSALAWWAGDIFAQPYDSKREITISKETSTPAATFVQEAEKGNVRIIVEAGVNLSIQRNSDEDETSGEQKGRMKPVLIGAGTEVVGRGDANLTFRAPMQLTGNGVSFQNIAMKFESSDGLYSVPHREIFLAGYSLTLDNVSTSNPVKPGMEGFGSSEEDMLPTVFAGSYKSNSSNDVYGLGSHAQLTVKNSGNGQTRFQAIYLSHEESLSMPPVKAPIAATYTGQATLTLDPRTQVMDGSGKLEFPSGIFAKETTNAEIIYTSTSASVQAPSVYPCTLNGNPNTKVTLSNALMDTRVNLNNVGQVQVGSKAEFDLGSGSSVQNVMLMSGGKLSPKGSARILGNFSGGGTIYFENDTDRLEILGDVSGSTELTQWMSLKTGERITTKTGTQTDAFFMNSAEYSLAAVEKDGKLHWNVEKKADPTPVQTLGYVAFKDEQGVNMLTDLTVHLDTLQDGNDTQRFKVVCSDLQYKYISPDNAVYETLLADMVAVKSTYWEAKDTAQYDNKTDWAGDLQLLLEDGSNDVFHLYVGNHDTTEDYTLLFFKSAQDLENASFADLKAAATRENLAEGSLKVKLVAGTTPPPQPPVEVKSTLTSAEKKYTFGQQAEFTFTTTDPDAQGKTVALYSGAQKLTEQTLTSGTAQLTYDTTGRDLLPGENTVTAVYDGKKDAAFCTVTVEAKPLSENMFAPIAPQIFNGSEQKPAVTSTEPAMQQGDYAVSYENNVHAGQAKAVVKAVDNGFFSGTVEKIFTIGKAVFGDKTAESSAKPGSAGTLDLSAYLCSGANIGQITTKDDKAILNGVPAVQDGKTLTYTFGGSAAAGSTAEITVPVTADDYESYTIRVKVTVTDKQAQAGFGFAGDAVTKKYVDEDFTLKADGAADGSTVTYSSSAEDVAAVDQNTGRVTITGVGRAVITAKASATADFMEAEDTYTLTVEKSTITITAGNKSAYVGDTAPVLGENDYTVVGLRRGEALKTKPSVKYVSIPDMSRPGKTEIQAYGAEVADKQTGCYDVVYVSGVLTVSTRPNVDGGGTFVPPSNTDTIKNPDGSTTTVTTRPDGTRVETTQSPNGDKTVIEQKKDGTTVTTKTNKAGDKTVSEVKADGSSVTSTRKADGTTATTTVNAYGKTEAKVDLSYAAVETAKKNDAPVELPIPSVQAVKNGQMAPEIKITTGSSENVEIKVPVSGSTSGTVAVIVYPDGTEKVVRKSVAGYDGVTVSVENGATVRIVDNAKSFSDTRGHWAEEAVAFVTGHELYNGMSASTFVPDGEMTRGMLAIVLHNLENNPKSYAANSFGDVRNNFWYTESILWAAEKGLVSGYETGAFGPDDPVSREQLAVILWRYAGCPKAYTSLYFTDAPKVADYAQEAMKWAVESGIVSGTDRGLLDPQGAATRAQVATMMMRFMEGTR